MGSVDEIKGINIHPVDFCCWKIETEWDEAKFVRPKTYIEHVTTEDGEELVGGEGFFKEQENGPDVICFKPLFNFRIIEKNRNYYVGI